MLRINRQQQTSVGGGVRIIIAGNNTLGTGAAIEANPVRCGARMHILLCCCVNCRLPVQEERPNVRPTCERGGRV